jgi:biopolymer transport protein ExbD
MHGRQKRQTQQSVELNLAAMLDMAFQLLTFFILTFQPAPVEGEIDLRMPPAQPLAARPNEAPTGRNPNLIDPLESLRTLVITLAANPHDGSLGAMQVGDELVGSPGRLDEKLRAIFALPASPIDQILIHVDANLNYAGLMSAVDVCARQVVADPSGHPRPLTKLSFVEMATN